MQARCDDLFDVEMSRRGCGHSSVVFTENPML